MHIECDMNDSEFDWVIEMYKELKNSGYRIKRVYRSDDGVTLTLVPIVVGEEISQVK